MCRQSRNNYGGRRGLVGTLMDPQQGQPGGYADPYCDDYSKRGSRRRGHRGGPLTGCLMGLRGEGQNNYHDQRRRNGPVGLLIGGVMALMNGRESKTYDQRQSGHYDQRPVDARSPRDADLREHDIQPDVRNVPARHSPREPDSKIKDESFGNRGHSDDESDDDERAERKYERHIQSTVAQQSQGKQFAPPPGPPPSYQAAIRGN
ncbi:hypothetical protein EDD36DRAFT_216748 [Exophiala viscosa]|uniref:Uncharacterized protein n=1 Tax=Exophiala viscosa TaxID=2486360 RepID=A0AAN6DZF9_9EURO|nr:hypothetical protein EDD36DRAFT_216748 [Exophiala viscosa]